LRKQCKHSVQPCRKAGCRLVRAVTWSIRRYGVKLRRPRNGLTRQFLHGAAYKAGTIAVGLAVVWWQNHR
jgi:hypothetical protein